MAELPSEAGRILHSGRRGVLTTIDPQGHPHTVPVCYVLREDEIITPIDAKPKSGRSLGRRRNVELNPAATFMVDRWDEEWSRLGWVMARGRARLEPMGDVGSMLAERYPQYADVFVGNDAIAISPKSISWWLWGDQGG